MVRRARGSAESTNRTIEKWKQFLRIQDRRRLLEQKRLVGRTSTLGNEEKLVIASGCRINLDLGRKIVSRVDLLVHRKRRDLAVSQVASEVSLEHTLRDRGLIIALCPDELAF